MLTYSNQDRVLCCIQGTGKEEGIVATPDQKPSIMLGTSKKAAWGSFVDGPYRPLLAVNITWNKRETSISY